jgi:hypothetical protein
VVQDPKADIDGLAESYPDIRPETVFAEKIEPDRDDL